jgi:hypothetical protein
MRSMAMSCKGFQGPRARETTNRACVQSCAANQFIEIAKSTATGTTRFNYSLGS